MTIIMSDSMRACVVRSNEYPLGSPFSFREGCFQYNCECHSDGSWECPADRAEDTCAHDQQFSHRNRTGDEMSVKKCEYEENYFIRAIYESNNITGRLY